jgi:hypothetical protein
MKMNTPRELYLQCLDDNLGKIPIPTIWYKISMDSRKKAAQATIDFLRSLVLNRCPRTVMVFTAILIQVLLKIKLCPYQDLLH